MHSSLPPILRVRHWKEDDLNKSMYTNRAIMHYQKILITNLLIQTG